MVYSNPLIYQFWTGQGGTGNQITGEVKLTSFYDGGSSFKAVITNTLNVPVYSNGLLINGRGAIYTLPGAAYSFIVDRTNGQPQKSFIVKSPFMCDFVGDDSLSSYGNAIAKYYADIVSASRAYPTIIFEGRPDVQYLQMGDRINVNLALYNLSSDYRVGAIDETWISQNGQAVQTTITTEPYVVATG